MINAIIFLSYIIAIFGFCEMMIYFDGPFDVIDRWRNFLYDRSEGLYKLFTCFACLSTWVGMLFSLLNILFIPIPITPFNIILWSVPGTWWLRIPLDAFFACGTTWMTHQLEEYMEHHQVIVYKDGVKYVYEEDKSENEAEDGGGVGK